MKYQSVLLMSGILLLTGCARDEGYPTQAASGIRNLGEAINHCREYTEYHVDGNPVISLDRLSTRRDGNFYEVYLNLDNKKESGWAHCRITMKGDIRVHRVYGFNKGGGFFG